jgi:DNA repair protein RadC
MRAASVKEIKTGLEEISPKELLSICLRLSKFKKENKELITYLLFEAQDEEAYIQSVKSEIDLSFESLNTSSMYIAKKNIRKIVRIANRYIKYSNQETTAVTLLIYVCSKIKSSGLNLNKSQALSNIYISLIKKIKLLISTLHEDLQYDFNLELNEIM